MDDEKVTFYNNGIYIITITGGPFFSKRRIYPGESSVSVPRSKLNIKEGWVSVPIKWENTKTGAHGAKTLKRSIKIGQKRILAAKK